MKVKVSITVDRELLRQARTLVDGLSIRNTSQSVEWLMRRSLRERRAAVIMAGGDPRKLVTAGKYRPLLDIGGRTLIEDNIERIRKSFSNIMVIGGAPVIGDVFRKIGDGNELGVNITYVEEKEHLGTAKTLELARQYLGSAFLFMPCDHWFDFDVKELMKFHARQDNVATLSVFQKTNFEWPVAVVEMEGDKITGYEEQPKRPKTHLRSTLIGVAEPSIFDRIPAGKVRWSLQENIFPQLAKEKSLAGYPVAGNWVNISSQKDIELIRKLSSK